MARLTSTAGTAHSLPVPLSRAILLRQRGLHDRGGAAQRFVTPGGRIAALAVAVMVGALGRAQWRRLPDPEGTARAPL